MHRGWPGSREFAHVDELVTDAEREFQFSGRDPRRLFFVRSWIDGRFRVVSPSR